METSEIQTLEELRAVAGKVLASTAAPRSGAAVLALSGDLGAGKTAFVKKLAEQLDIAEEVTSPTFVIMKSYTIPEHPLFKTLTHIDAYRVDDTDEMRVLGWAELLSDPTRLIAVEWPERIPEIIPEDAHRIALALSGGMRTVTF
jgi:tRNA threonylcarbamoyladenosine biosynthesis protein TsaE